MERQVNYLQALRDALVTEMRLDPRVVVPGEDVPAVEEAREDVCAVRYAGLGSGQALRDAPVTEMRLDPRVVVSGEPWRAVEGTLWNVK